MRAALEQLRNKSNLIGAEIGVYYGDNALDYLGNLDIKKIYLIDPYTIHPLPHCYNEQRMKESEKEARAKLDIYKDKIEWVRTKSAEAASLFDDESLDFVYIDGDHSYKFIHEDMTLYYPKVKKDGLFSGHDYRGYAPGVIAAVNEFCKKNFLDLHRGGQMDWWIWK